MSEDTSVALTAAGILSLFGTPTFALPEREVTSKWGSKLVAQVTVPFGGFELETAVWSKELVHADKGETELVLSVRLPAAMKVPKGDDEAGYAVREWQQATLNACDAWLDTIDEIAAKRQAEGKKAQSAPRLVRKVKHAQPTAVDATVQAAAAIAQAVVAGQAAPHPNSPAGKAASK